MEYYTSFKKETLSFATIDGTIGHFAKWSKSATERQIPHDFI